ncbi:MAG: excinuclease ABC subunit UvrB [Myxococcota bacterium]
MPKFSLKTPYSPSGDQPEAIAQLLDGLANGDRAQTLLGATGTGKTFTIAQVLAQYNRPTLVLCHNKTLAAQLYGELKGFFPDNQVSYFVSYYDYYQPEAYVPSSDTYIPKDAQINEQIDKLRHAATRSLLEFEDVVIVSSVSCIYGLGSKEAYDGMLIPLNVGMEVERDELIAGLVHLLFTRNDMDFHRGCFRVRGDVVDIFPAHEDSIALRISFFGDEIEEITLFDPLTGNTIESLNKTVIYPASHYVMPEERLEKALIDIRSELQSHLHELKASNKLLEAQRLEERTSYDLEMIEHTGRCNGIENYSRYLSGRESGEPPPTLLEYFPDDWLLIVDESHVTIPQVRGMFKGDRSRKSTLVTHGFRLPSALDNRPLQFSEFEEKINQVIFVSATPGPYELHASEGVIVEQIIRPTGLLDPTVEIKPIENQVDVLFDEIQKVIQNEQRVLVTTLSKRMAQELTNYYQELGLRVRYLHSDIDTLERIEILQGLRRGEFDVLIGINLLREGLDIPEVELVAILDADKQGFLRNRTSLIQTIGRAARNAQGRVILFAERITPAMSEAISETERRRSIQEAYNAKHDIVPKTISKEVSSPLEGIITKTKSKKETINAISDVPLEEVNQRIKSMKREMKAAAKSLKFEQAAELRDQIKLLELRALGMR